MAYRMACQNPDYLLAHNTNQKSREGNLTAPLIYHLSSKDEFNPP